ncbi:MAG: ISAs1 family transposase [Firmicutes bacterium]|nr:ISAs1 family transposase [Bacillota bacterium]
MEIEALKESIEGITDPRRTRYGNLRHKLEDIIIIGLCTVICKGEDFVDMEKFGKSREEFLAKFLELPNGIHNRDTFRRVFERLDPTELAECLYNWLSVEREKRSVIAVDGKSIRGSGNVKHKAYHVVSAFVAENQLTFGEVCVDEKTNEITAVPELLDLIDAEGAIVTADAMNCQKKTVEKIIEKKADYTIGLKENQPVLYKDCEDCFRDFHKELPMHDEIDKGHGRIERREYRLVTELSWLEQKTEWDGLSALGMAKSTVEENGETRVFTRYFITSLTDVNEFAYSVRKHWCIENQLHWCLDVIFREDASTARKDNSPLNMKVLRKVALNVVSQAQYGRVSKKKLMFRAALVTNTLLDILFHPKM